MVRGFVAALALMGVSAPAFAQLEFKIDEALELPPIDFDAYPKQHYIHDFDGEPVHGPDYAHWNYIVPESENAGTQRSATRGTFDSFNTLISRGQVGAGVRTLLYTRLLTSSADDLDSVYVGGAEYVQMPEDRSWVLYKLRDEMRFSDGTPVTAQDVIYSFLQQWEHSSSFAPAYQDDILSVTDEGDNRVLFRFSETAGREMPVQMGIGVIYPQHYWEEEGAERTLAETFLEPPIGNGPYEITDFRQGQFIEFTLKEDWWGMDLPAYEGSFAKTIVYQYYGDAEAIREAVKAGDIDLFVENSSKSWALDWEDIPAIEAGDLRKEERPETSLQSPQMFVFNMRRAPFDDRLVREALSYTFDFETTNETAFFNQYSRTASFFQNSDLQATGEPQGEELAVLQELFDTYGEEHVPSEVFGPAFVNPATGDGVTIRDNLRKALEIFAAAGWNLNDAGELVNAEGEQLAFTYIYNSANTRRYADPWIENMRRIGIDAEGRLMDPNAWWDAVRNRDFDATSTILRSDYLGQLIFYTWGSELKDNPQSRAMAGLDNPAVDDLARRILAADNRADVNTLSRAVDRLLTHNNVGIFQWYVPDSRLVWWNKFVEPEVKAEFGSATTGWYIDSQMESDLIGRSNYSLN